MTSTGVRQSDLQPDFLDLQAVTARLSVSPRTVRKWVHALDRPLPAYRVGGKFLFRWAEVEAWLASHRVQPVSVSDQVDAILKTLQPRQAAGMHCVTPETAGVDK